jgi:Ca2+-transporting ATPase
MRSLRDIADHFPAARDAGLTADQVVASRDRFGANRLTPLPREPGWKKFLEKFDEPIIKILLAASLLKIVVDLFGADPLAGALGLAAVVVALLGALFRGVREWLPSILFALAGVLFGVSVGLAHPSFEGLAVMVAVALATGVAFLSEYRSDREFEALNARKDDIRVKVVRDGAVRTVGLEDVVVGDLVVLEMGDEVPADARVVRATELTVDQSLMTGESEPVRKAVAGHDDAAEGPEVPGCVYRGTQVVDGAGQVVVANVGDDTMLGQLARRLSGEPDESEAGGGRPPAGAGTAEARIQRKLTLSKAATPLQRKLAALAGLISKVGYAAAAAIFVALLARGLYLGEVRWPAPGEDRGAVFLASVNALLDYFVYMVIVIVVAVPEGLPMSVTVSLALAMRKMTRANALVRQLVATETIGSATVICSDKTGTLTQNRMTVARVGLAGRVFERTLEDGTLLVSSAVGDWPRPGSPLDLLVLNAAVNSTAGLEVNDGKAVTVGNTTEGALLQWLRAGAWFRPDDGLDYADLRRQYAVLYQIHFSSDRKRMTTVAGRDGRAVVLVKGAPEVVLDRCRTYLAADGTRRPLAEVREAVEAQLKAAAGDAMRTLAFAAAELPADFPRDPEAIHARRDELEADLGFVGWVAIRDPLRADVRGAVDECRAAGIAVKMITGDNVETARAIGREVGLLSAPGSLALTSAEFNALSDDELKQKLPDLHVLARARPLDKYRMVRLLQDQGHVVAMTGDGTNDAPSLKKADVGLAMGVAGTEVAKEASKIVLLDDAFSTIVRAVHWGRALYENIQRFVQFQLTINVSALTIAFLGPFVGLRPPFTVLQLLWINVIMDTFAAIALCSEPPRPGLMRARPKRRDENILTRAMIGNILVTAAFFVVVMIGLLVGMQRGGWFAGPGPVSGEFDPLTVRQVTIFFTVYVFFQVWNQINCRSLSPAESGLYRLFDNPQFLAIASLTVVGQVLIVTLGGPVFGVEPLGVVDWLVIAAATSSVLVFAEVARRVRKAV